MALVRKRKSPGRKAARRAEAQVGGEKMGQFHTVKSTEIFICRNMMPPR